MYGFLVDSSSLLSSQLTIIINDVSVCLFGAAENMRNSFAKYYVKI